MLVGHQRDGGRVAVRPGGDLLRPVHVDMDLRGALRAHRGGEGFSNRLDASRGQRALAKPGVEEDVAAMSLDEVDQTRFQLSCAGEDLPAASSRRHLCRLGLEHRQPSRDPVARRRVGVAAPLESTVFTAVVGADVLGDRDRPCGHLVRFEVEQALEETRQARRGEGDDVGLRDLEGCPHASPAVRSPRSWGR